MGLEQDMATMDLRRGFGPPTRNSRPFRKLAQLWNQFVNGPTYFVDPLLGNDSNAIAAVGNVQSNDWSNAFASIGAAVTQANTQMTTGGNILLAPGTYSEGGITLSANNVRISGVALNPNAVVWQEAAVDTILLTVTGLRCALENIKFRPPTRSGGTVSTCAAVKLYTAATTSLGSASFRMSNVVFQGRATSYTAFLAACDTTHQQDDVVIENCTFQYMNTATSGGAILGTEANGQTFSNWVLRNNRFLDNTTDVNLGMTNGLIQNNVFGLLPSAGTKVAHLDLRGTGANYNSVTGNTLTGTYSNIGFYWAANTGDDWNGNIAAGALTTANPA